MVISRDITDIIIIGKFIMAHLSINCQYGQYKKQANDDFEIDRKNRSLRYSHFNLG